MIFSRSFGTVCADAFLFFFLLEQQFSCYSIANQLFNTFKEEKVVGNNIQNYMSTISDLHLAVVQVD